MSHPERSTAFLSYARADARRDEHLLSQLRDDLSDEVQAQTELPFELFLDVEDIGWGEDWEARLTAAVRSADVFIPVVTPSFLNSQWCRKEVALFDKKQGLQGANLILPLYYIRSEDFEDPEVQQTDEVVQTLRRANWLDWTAVRQAPPQSPARLEKIIEAAKGLARALASHREQVAPDREVEAREILNAAHDLVDTDPRQAVILYNQLLTHYRDSPLIYRMWGTIQRARALVNLGAPQEAVAQLDLLIDRLLENFPPGHPKIDPTMQNLIASHIQMARNLRSEITGEKPPPAY